jgi:hypothetical protein
VTTVNWKLARTLAFCLAALATVLVPRYHPPRPDAPPSMSRADALSDIGRWVASSPRRTAGCPALQTQFAAWRRELRYEDWTLTVSCRGDLAHRGLLGVTYLDPEHRSAEIRILDGMSRGWQNFVLVHELAHVGVAAKRLAVPPGGVEEDFVERVSEDVFVARYRDVYRRMLADARARGSSTGQRPAP